MADAVLRHRTFPFEDSGEERHGFEAENLGEFFANNGEDLIFGEREHLLAACAAQEAAEDGAIVEAVYSAGETRHFTYGKGEHKIHDLENVGDADLWFTTVEFFDIANSPLELGPRTP